MFKHKNGTRKEINFILPIAFRRSQIWSWEHLDRLFHLRLVEKSKQVVDEVILQWEFLSIKHRQHLANFSRTNSLVNHFSDKGRFGGSISGLVMGKQRYHPRVLPKLHREEWFFIVTCVITQKRKGIFLTASFPGAQGSGEALHGSPRVESVPAGTPTAVPSTFLRAVLCSPSPAQCPSSLSLASALSLHSSTITTDTFSPGLLPSLVPLPGVFHSRHPRVTFLQIFHSNAPFSVRLSLLYC